MDHTHVASVVERQRTCSEPLAQSQIRLTDQRSRSQPVIRMLATRDAWSTMDHSWLLGHPCTGVTAASRRFMTPRRYPPPFHQESRTLPDAIRGRCASSVFQSGPSGRARQRPEPVARELRQGSRVLTPQNSTRSPTLPAPADRPTLAEPVPSSTTTSSATGPSPVPRLRTTMTVCPPFSRVPESLCRPSLSCQAEH